MPFPLLLRFPCREKRRRELRPCRAKGEARKKTRGETGTRRKRWTRNKRDGEGGKEKEREKEMWDERENELLSEHRCASNISHVVIATESVYRAVL